MLPAVDWAYAQEGSSSQIVFEDTIESYASNNAGDFQVEGGNAGDGWTYDSEPNTLVFNKSGTYKVTGNGVETREQINVRGRIQVTLTISNINSAPAYAGMNIDPEANVILILEGENIIKAGHIHNAGIEFNNATTGSLEIKGTGSLHASSLQNGSGIGGGYWSSGKNITISGGTVTATGVKGAGIGGGYGNSGVNITISGGTVTATSSNGSGIGGGYNGSGKDIKITGGSVKTNSISVGPTDADGNAVYLAKLAVQDGIDQITVDDSLILKRAGSHPDMDTAFYLYLTGSDHYLTTENKNYFAAWDSTSESFSIKSCVPAPIPDAAITSKTANSITVSAPGMQETYGKALYSSDGTAWQESNVLEHLRSNRQYTVYVKYTGKAAYLESEKAARTETTLPASYTITIPAAAKADGNTVNIAVNRERGFDLGHGGHVDIKIKNGITNGILILKRQGASNTVTSALSVNGKLYTDTAKNLAIFRTREDSPVSVSFGKPTETNIPAGIYTGTLTFEITYAEQED